MNKKAQTLSHQLSVWSIGGSIFAMFFGAGNIVFPLALGCQYHSHPGMACLGMIITAVVVPLLGLFVMLLYSGNYQTLFASIGKVPGFLFVALILGFIGPFGGIPRTITISHATLISLSATDTSIIPALPIFSLVFSVLIYVFVCKLSKLIQWLGSIFSPILLVTLCWIIVKGLQIPTHINPVESYTRLQSWTSGLNEGFNTMDLLGAFFFCSILLISIRQMVHPDMDSEIPLDFHSVSRANKRKLGLGSLLAGVLLSAVYFGFTFIAARHSQVLSQVADGQTLGKISAIALGPNSLLTGTSVFIACLTTAIALVGIFSDFLVRVISHLFLSKKLSYSSAVIITLVSSYFISLLGFENISAIFLRPFVQYSYPALIALTCGCIAHKLWRFRHTKALFYSTLLLTVLFKTVC